MGASSRRPSGAGRGSARGHARTRSCLGWKRAPQDAAPRSTTALHAGRHGDGHATPCGPVAAARGDHAAFRSAWSSRFVAVCSPGAERTAQYERRRRHAQGAGEGAGAACRCSPRATAGSVCGCRPDGQRFIRGGTTGSTRRRPPRCGRIRGTNADRARAPACTPPDHGSADRCDDRAGPRRAGNGGARQRDLGGWRIEIGRAHV